MSPHSSRHTVSQTFRQDDCAQQNDRLRALFKYMRQKHLENICNRK